MMAFSYLPHDGYFGPELAPIQPSNNKEMERQQKRERQMLIAQQLTQMEIEADARGLDHVQRLQLVFCLSLAL